MARMRRKLVAGMVLLGLSGIATAAAESVPLPKPPPQPKEGTTAPTARAAGVQPQNPVADLANGLKSLFNPDATSTTAFTPAQRTQVNKVSAYLSSVQQTVGHFVQIAPDGSRSKGVFYVQKPGRVRFEYDAPSPIEIIADGQSVVVRDRRLATQDIYPLSQTPLRFLLADRIDLLRETNVVAVRSDDVYVTVVIEERQVLIGTSQLTMMLGIKDYQLKQWTITDPQGQNTTVMVSQLDSSKRPDANLFRVDHTRYAQ